MTDIPVIYFLWVSAFLFATGLAILLLKKNTIFVLMGIELILNAANLNLVAFSKNDPSLQGLYLSIFVLVVGICEMAIALAIVLQVYRNYRAIEVDQFKSEY
jgi:NADH:ubiquinone oxidoreductase subunit K